MTEVEKVNKLIEILCIINKNDYMKSSTVLFKKQMQKLLFEIKNYLSNSYIFS